MSATASSRRPATRIITEANARYEKFSLQVETATCKRFWDNYIAYKGVEIPDDVYSSIKMPFVNPDPNGMELPEDRTMRLVFCPHKIQPKGQGQRTSVYNQFMETRIQILLNTLELLETRLVVDGPLYQLERKNEDSIEYDTEELNLNQEIVDTFRYLLLQFVNQCNLKLVCGHPDCTRKRNKYGPQFQYPGQWLFQDRLRQYEKTMTSKHNTRLSNLETSLGRVIVPDSKKDRQAVDARYWERDRPPPRMSLFQKAQAKIRQQQEELDAEKIKRLAYEATLSEQAQKLIETQKALTGHLDKIKQAENEAFLLYKKTKAEIHARTMIDATRVTRAHADAREREEWKSTYVAELEERQKLERMSREHDIRWQYRMLRQKDRDAADAAAQAALDKETAEFEARRAVRAQAWQPGGILSGLFAKSAEKDAVDETIPAIESSAAQETEVIQPIDNLQTFDTAEDMTDVQHEDRSETFTMTPTVGSPKLELAVDFNDDDIYASPPPKENDDDIYASPPPKENDADIYASPGQEVIETSDALLASLEGAIQSVAQPPHICDQPNDDSTESDISQEDIELIDAFPCAQAPDIFPDCALDRASPYDGVTAFREAQESLAGPARSRSSRSPVRVLPYPTDPDERRALRQRHKSAPRAGTSQVPRQRQSTPTLAVQPQQDDGDTLESYSGFGSPTQRDC